MFHWRPARRGREATEDISQPQSGWYWTAEACVLKGRWKASLLRAVPCTMLPLQPNPETSTVQSSRYPEDDQRAYDGNRNGAREILSGQSAE